MKICEFRRYLKGMTCIKHVQRSGHIFERTGNSGEKRSRLQSERAFKQKPAEIAKTQVADPPLKRRQLEFTVASEESCSEASKHSAEATDDTEEQPSIKARIREGAKCTWSPSKK